MTGNQEPAMTKKDFSLTFCQVISALAVATLHTNGCFWGFSATESYWFSANIIDSVFYFAVPVFFMITGITLADYKERYSTKTFFKKRIEKTLIPYIVWSLLALVFLLATGTLKPADITPSWIITSVIWTSNIIAYYWFFGALFAFYLLMPFIASIEKDQKLKVFKVLIIIIFVCDVTIFFFLKLFNAYPEVIDTSGIGFGNLIFVLLGYYIYKKPPVLSAKIAIYILAAIGLLVHMVGTYYLSMKTGEVNEMLKGYANFPSIFYSLGAFILLRDIAVKIEKIGWLRKLIETLGKYTFEVFLLHWFVINITGSLITIDDKNLAYRLLFPLFIYAVTVIVTWLLRKIPVIRKIVP